ncbi:2,3-bisphosphoglycerate-independent phosphoglycerate mutase [Chitinivorax tropicus]|uniref:2,3-bisphosphoglycerate-independent phosphoglycerate mutase n=1 Tax=Chitinivorax tropicus TaxID=714531 RepID=A0A840MMJ8_9PROT|nr:2,3-bisphosphoglycerate-independent phosphoglycerate mutase [Chitinivorax tropicus]MBB5018167.1 2,3-bisphosphoglycerate-independent phosphoglycerate mutase [Chitinivorax tropicus]
MNTVKPVVLLILDGFGHRLEGDDNAILHAHKPNWDSLCQRYPYTTINASEQFVGLPAHQFGNSEVGHLNIGAGRVIRQDISRIDYDIETGAFFDNPTLVEAVQQAKRTGGTLHLMGLVSDGGVHSHENHLFALLKLAAQHGLSAIAVHAFLDGRDTPPRSAEAYLAKLEAACKEYGGRIATLSGRYFAMDRDKRWERVEPVYDMLTQGVAAYQAATASQGLAAAYERGENDEFVKPTIIGQALPIRDGDAVIFINFRADRARQLTQALNWKTFDGFPRKATPNLSYFCSMSSYGEAYTNPVAFPPQHFSNTLGEYLANQGLKQLRIAETEKYPHVTYFLSGGEEQPFPGEDRILIPSPKVATYDLQPEMSAFEVTDKLVAAIESGQYAAMICNYANGDMVGHTGIFDAAKRAIETLDQCLGRVVEAAQKAGVEVLITADHGNAEMMHDDVSGQMHTQHTTNLVPFLYVGRPATLAETGALQDVAPTLLHMMGLPKPAEMTGHSLIQFA